MKNTTILLIIGILIIAVGFFVFSGAREQSVTGNVIAGSNSGDAQEIVLSQEGLNYKDVEAEAGKPIKISADSSVKGCLRSVSFNIGGKRYLKYLGSSQDFLELPALDKGIYTFTCSMSMGAGKLGVE
ncbi:MAG: hypothetical protein AABY16_01375 [Nanoarchaeota archaeon]